MNIKHVLWFLLLQMCVSHIYAEQHAILDDVIEHEINNYDDRYSLITDLLDRYERSFTLLNLNTHLGYYAFQAAQDYDATCVMIENTYHQKISDVCKKNAHLDNIILLKKSITDMEFERLTQCEHFDVW